MADQTVQVVAAVGIVPTYAAAAASDTFTDDGSQRTLYQIKNTGTQKIATIVPPQATETVPGVGLITIPTMTVTIPATTGDKMIGPFSPAYISSAGKVTVALDGIAGASVAAIKLAKVG